ncbi:MAG: XRE family transcriptional regulator [Bacteroidales bacterium]|nr:XRE family transcriptional regulator [Bacteroidales bacterium]
MKKEIHIGKKIKEVLKSQGRTATWFSQELPCDRSNLYHIFNNDSINTRQLLRISDILNYDFFLWISEESKMNDENI